MDCKEFLLTSSQSNPQYSVCLWDYETKNVLKLYKSGGTVAPKSLEILNKEYVLTAEIGKPILHVWALNSQEVANNIRLILPEPTNCLAICPNNSFLAVGIGRKLYIWQISSGKLLSVQQKSYQSITCIKFSSDGSYLVLTGQDGLLICYHFVDLVTLHNNLLSQNEIGQIEPLYTKNDHSMPILDLHIGSFGRKSRIATVSIDQTCKIYALSTGDILLSLAFLEPLTSVTFDSACWELYVGSSTGSIHQFHLKDPPRTMVHHVESNTELTYVGHKKRIVCLCLNSNNTILASGSEDNFVFTWEMRSRQILQKFEHKSAVTNVRFVANFKNFFAENFKPTLVLKGLERSIDADDDFVVSIVQSNEIEECVADDALKRKRNIEEISEENRKLRVINGQLYNAIISLNRKAANGKT